MNFPVSSQLAGNFGFPGDGFARPASRDVLTQKTECSPQLARLTAGHICMRGDYVRRPELPVIPTKAMVPLGDLQIVYGVDRARLLPNGISKGSANQWG